METNEKQTNEKPRSLWSAISGLAAIGYLCYSLYGCLDANQKRTTAKDRILENYKTVKEMRNKSVLTDKSFYQFGEDNNRVFYDSTQIELTEIIKISSALDAIGFFITRQNPLLIELEQDGYYNLKVMTQSISKDNLMNEKAQALFGEVAKMSLEDMTRMLPDKKLRFVLCEGTYENEVKRVEINAK
jgi:hypothetical protein